MDLNQSVIVSSSSDSEKEGSDSTDYEPEPKKLRLVDDYETKTNHEFGEAQNHSIKTGSSTSTGASTTEIDGNVHFNAESESEDRSSLASLTPKPNLPAQESEEQGQGMCFLTQPLSEVPGNENNSGTDRTMISTNNSISNNSVLSPVRRQRRRRRERSARSGLELSWESSSRSSCSRGSSSYLSDDIDPMEIPSDEYLSPPSPPRIHNRQRRNAIFERRDPPPSVLGQNEDDRFYQNEFEVASVSDINENPIEDANSSSGAEEVRCSPVVEMANEKRVDETDNNFADIETLRSDVDSDDSKHSSKSKRLDSSDSELSDKDKWFCTQCNAKSMPYFRYCLRCFKIRRNWLPKRPASRRLKSRKAAQRNSLNNSRTTRSSCASEGEDVVDGGRQHRSEFSQNINSLPIAPSHTNEEVQPCSSSQIQRNLPSINTVDMNQGFIVDNANPARNRISSDTQAENITLLQLFASPPHASQDSSVLNRSTDATTDVDVDCNIVATSSSQSASSQSQRSLYSQGSIQSALSSDFSSQSQSSSAALVVPSSKTVKPEVTCRVQTLCTICYVRDKDAAFVHNKIAHHYCCFSCADKILKKDGKCPICRERVLRVVKIISV